MYSVGEYLREQRENKGLPLKKVAAELDIDTSILSRVERSERTATKEMLPVLTNILDIDLREWEMRFIREQIQTQFGDMKYLKDALDEAVQEL